jgi:UDP-N-acetylmuramate dehydrogenase
MVLDREDSNRRSVGSFFLNPVLDKDSAEALRERAIASGVKGEHETVPVYDDGRGGFKASAAWLVERAGFAKGTRRGCVGLSSKHALALVHHGGGTTSDLLALARDIRSAVEERFGVRLEPEPTFLGFTGADPLEYP